MSVRRRHWRNRKTGALEEKWMVDIKFRHPDGHVERIRQHSPVQTRRGAEQYERELRRALLDGSYGRKEAEKIPTFSAFADDFVTIYARANNKPSEIDSKTGILQRHLKPYFGAKRLDRIGVQDIEAYKVQKLEDEGLKAKTLYNHLTVLAKLFRVAVEWGTLQSAPRVRQVRVMPPKFDFLTVEEADQLVEQTQGQLRIMVLTALHTGLRIGELRGLRWEDVDLAAGKLYVHQTVWRADTIGPPKGGRSREVPLNAVVRQALRAHRHLRGPYVFCRTDGRLQGEMQMYKPLHAACRRAGLRRVSWHVLRHTFGSHLTQQGVPLKAVQELMGHASIEMTLRYAHLSPDVRRDAVNVLTPKGRKRGTPLVAQEKTEA